MTDVFEDPTYRPELIKDLSARTGLSEKVVNELLENDWSYIEDHDGHRWTINALQKQSVAVQPDIIPIPEVLLPGSGIPINAQTVLDVWNYYTAPFKNAKKKQTAEDVVLLAILRSVRAGYKKLEEDAKAIEAFVQDPTEGQSKTGE